MARILRIAVLGLHYNVSQKKHFQEDLLIIIQGSTLLGGS